MFQKHSESNTFICKKNGSYQEMREENNAVKEIQKVSEFLNSLHFTQYTYIEISTKKDTLETSV